MLVSTSTALGYICEGNGPSYCCSYSIHLLLKCRSYIAYYIRLHNMMHYYTLNYPTVQSNEIVSQPLCR